MTHKEYYLCPITGYYFQKGAGFIIQATDIHVIDINAYKVLQFKYKQLIEFIEKNLKVVTKDK